MKPNNNKKKVKFPCFYFPGEVLTGLPVKWSCRLGNEVTISPSLTILNSGEFEHKMEVQFQFYKSKPSTLRLVKSLKIKVCFKYSSGRYKRSVCGEQIILSVWNWGRGLWVLARSLTDGHRPSRPCCRKCSWPTVPGPRLWSLPELFSAWLGGKMGSLLSIWGSSNIITTYNICRTLS